MTELKPYQWLDANQLKLIAIVAMTVDHIAWLLFPGYAAGAVPIVMHIIGRITCPVMCFFIAEGFHYTRDRKKYALRLFMLAVVSHFAYMLASNSYVDWHSFIPFYYGDVLNQTSVVWSLLGGLLMLWLCEDEKAQHGGKGCGCIADLPDYIAQRLELYCRPVRAFHWLQPGRTEETDRVESFLCGNLCSGVLLRAG